LGFICSICPGLNCTPSAPQVHANGSPSPSRISFSCERIFVGLIKLASIGKNNLISSDVNGGIISLLNKCGYVLLDDLYDN
jgi:hypothetical protein